jgi:transcriptional regulator GlxA family with amidase domain
VELVSYGLIRRKGCPIPLGQKCHLPIILRQPLKASFMKKSTRTIGFLVAPPFELLDLAGPIAVFSNANIVPEGTRRPYEIKIISAEEGSSVTSADGSWMGPATPCTEFQGSLDTLLVVGGMGCLKPITPSLRAWLRKRAKRVRRLGSICLGAFILADAGLLKNRRAVTHWRFCSELSRRYPDLKVELNPIFIKEGNMYTTAGVSAGIDLSLALTEEDEGFKSANWVARNLVLFLRRSGDQAQYSSVLREQEKVSEPGFRNLPAWAMANLRLKLDVATLARFASMSPRTFVRRFHKEFNMSPAHWVRTLRVEAARDRLESSSDGLKQIATSTGFRDELNLRRAFVARFGISPRDYRQQMRGKSLEKANFAAA